MPACAVSVHALSKTCLYSGQRDSARHRPYLHTICRLGLNYRLRCPILTMCGYLTVPNRFIPIGECIMRQSEYSANCALIVSSKRRAYCARAARRATVRAMPAAVGRSILFAVVRVLVAAIVAAPVLALLAGWQS